MIKRRQIPADLKAKVALAAIQGEMTTSEISSKFQVHSSQITRWKKQAMGSLKEAFSNGKRPSLGASSQESDELYKEIGKLKVENEWLKKKSELLFS